MTISMSSIKPEQAAFCKLTAAIVVLFVRGPRDGMNVPEWRIVLHLARDMFCEN